MIPKCPSQRIIHGLEARDFQQHESHALSTQSSIVQILAQAVFKQTPVRQSGYLIVERKLTDVILGSLLLTDVFGRTLQVLERSTVEKSFDVQSRPVARAVAGNDLQI